MIDDPSAPESPRLEVTLLFDPSHRDQFARCLDEFIPAMVIRLGWVNHRRDIEADEPLCHIEWAIGSTESLSQLETIEAEQPKPVWWTALEPLVQAERIDLVEGERRTTLQDTLKDPQQGP